MLYEGLWSPSQLLLLLRVADIVFTRNETRNELVNNGKPENAQ